MPSVSKLKYDAADNATCMAQITIRVERFDTHSTAIYVSKVSPSTHVQSKDEFISRTNAKYMPEDTIADALKRAERLIRDQLKASK